MKRVDVLVNGVSEEIKNSFKAKRITKAFEVAMLNAQEDLEIAKAELEEFPSKAPSLEADDVIQTLFDIYGRIEDAEAVVSRLTKIKEYLETEVSES